MLLLLIALLVSDVRGTDRSQAADRRMAITIDDLPYMNVGSSNTYLDNGRRVTREILRVLRAHRAAAVGFVNEGQLSPPAEREQRIALLEQWVDAGMTLGNHTYSHPDFNRQTVAQFERQIVDGEPVTRRLMAPKSPYQPYFRHPMTHTGDTKEKKEAIERFLAARGYRVAPHTIENFDFLFNVAYVDGRRHNDAAFVKRLRDLYLDYTMEATAFAERLSIELFGREVPQTLLIHANDINADCLDEMMRRLEARSYRFITLDEAMADPAYRTPDTYVGTLGPTWWFRWAATLDTTLSVTKDPPMPPLPSRGR